MIVSGAVFPRRNHAAQDRGLPGAGQLHEKTFVLPVGALPGDLEMHRESRREHLGKNDQLTRAHPGVCEQTSRTAKIRAFILPDDIELDGVKAGHGRHAGRNDSAGQASRDPSGAVRKGG